MTETKPSPLRVSDAACDTRWEEHGKVIAVATFEREDAKECQRGIVLKGPRTRAGREFRQAVAVEHLLAARAKVSLKMGLLAANLVPCLAPAGALRRWRLRVKRRRPFCCALPMLPTRESSGLPVTDQGRSVAQGPSAARGKGWLRLTEAHLGSPLHMSFLMSQPYAGGGAHRHSGKGAQHAKRWRLWGETQMRFMSRSTVKSPASSDGSITL